MKNVYIYKFSCRLTTQGKLSFLFFILIYFILVFFFLRSYPFLRRLVFTRKYYTRSYHLHFHDYSSISDIARDKRVSTSLIFERSEKVQEHVWDVGQLENE